MAARLRSDRGFMMVAILIGMGVTAIMMTALVPKWIQQTQRTREEELIFRGEQYARAIAMFSMKNRGAYPMDLDILVSQKYLRKKWKDPVTGKDFQLIGIGIVQPGVLTTPVGGTTPQVAGTGRSGGASQVATTGNPGISGVRSFSTATSIKTYNQQTQHNLWAFDAQTYAQRIFGVNLATLASGGQQGGRQGGPGGAQPGARQGGPAGPGGAPGQGGRQGGGPPGGLGPGRTGGTAPPATGPGRGGGRGAH